VKNQEKINEGLEKHPPKRGMGKKGKRDTWERAAICHWNQKTADLLIGGLLVILFPG
jgi:hypothetical protein